MGSSSATLHEDTSVLGPAGIDYHRAIVSLMEELEAIDWYNQRVAAADDDGLREVLRHNRDEEKEHAAMTLEWLRRHDPELDRFLRVYLFTEGSIVGEEAAAEAAAETVGAAGLGIGAVHAKEVL